VLAFAATLQVPGSAPSGFTWFTFGEQTLRLEFVLDPLAAAMARDDHVGGALHFCLSIGLHGRG